MKMRRIFCHTYFAKKPISPKWHMILLYMTWRNALSKVARIIDFQRCVRIICRGVSRRLQTGGPSKSLILSPWSKVEEGRPHPHPSPSIWRPWSFLPWSSSGAPLLVLEWRPIRHVDLSFSFFFPFFPSFFISFSFPPLFLFWRPFCDPGAEASKALPRIRPWSGKNHLQ